MESISKFKQNYRVTWLMKNYKEEIFNEIRTCSLKFSFHESNKRLSGKLKKAVHSIQRVL